VPELEEANHATTMRSQWRCQSSRRPTTCDHDEDSVVVPEFEEAHCLTMARRLRSYITEVERRRGA
jgi:hypothetical protein